MARVTWTAPALSHLDEIRDYIAQDSVARAEKLYGRVLKAVDQLELFPLLGSIVPEFEGSDLRELIVRPYRILYIPRGEVCWIVAVIHGSRDLSRLIRLEDLPEDHP